MDIGGTAFKRFHRYLSLEKDGALRENKDLLNRGFDGAGDVDGEFEGGVVLGFFEAHDGFAADADAFGKFFLGPAFGGAELFKATFKFNGWHGASLCLFVAVEEIVGEEDHKAVDERDGGEHEDGAPFDVAAEKAHAHEPDDDEEEDKADAVGFKLSTTAIFLEEFVLQSVGEAAFEEESEETKEDEENEGKDFVESGVGPKSAEAEKAEKSEPAEFRRDGARVAAAVFGRFRREHEVDDVAPDGDEKINDVEKEQRARNDHRKILRLEDVGGEIHHVDPTAVVESEGISDAGKQQRDDDDSADDETADGFLWQAFIHDKSLLSVKSDLFIS